MSNDELARTCLCHAPWRMGWTHETTHWHKHICANTSEDGLGVAGLGCIEFVVLYCFNTTHTTQTNGGADICHYQHLVII